MSETATASPLQNDDSHSHVTKVEPQEGTVSPANPTASSDTTTTTSGNRICDYYLRSLLVPGSRPCNKGDNCDFDHPRTAPNGSVCSRVCAFYYRNSSCNKV